MAVIAEFKTDLGQLRDIITRLTERVPGVAAQLHPPGAPLRGLSDLQQPRLDPHRNIRNPRSLAEWVTTLETAATSLEAMSTRWP